MRVSETVGRALAGLGADTVFGLIGSGNFHVTNGLIAGGAKFIAARHEGGAAVMADAWARTTGRVGVVSVHQGPGLTNAITGITEAAKSRTPLLWPKRSARCPSGCTPPRPRWPTPAARTRPR
jgi:acetolactate synthase-1/2/3 large subunit